MFHSVPHMGPKSISRVLREIATPTSGEEVNLSELDVWRVSADTLQRQYKLHPESAHCIAERKDSF